MRLTFTFLSFLTFLPLSFSQIANPHLVASQLQARITDEPNAFHSIHIVLADRVDLAGLDAQLSAQRAKAGERSAVVLTALKEKSAATQSDLLNFLKNSPSVKPETVHSYWVANAIFAHVKKDVIEALSRRPDVAWIGLNGKLKADKFEKAPPPPNFSPNGKEPGLNAIKAPFMWKMGYTGYGQVAFTNDTGIDPDHPAIASRYRGFYAPKDQAWFELDPWTLQRSNNYDPYDCDEHGTHVNGTILGLDRMTNDTIGVAFNAQWIGAPILCGIGTEDNIAAFEWSLDPDGNPNTAEDMPDIINNSWYDPTLDEIDCFSIYVPVLEAMEAAGIAVIFSAGNEGPDIMTITPPHNINIHELNSFTVGALNGNTNSFPIASFSSRGPSHCGGDSSLLIKPEVSAPGVSVRSCIPGNAYDFFNGTSMASPHVSGAILLLKEAFPDLTGYQLKEAIYFSCRDLGNVGEDNIFGMGIIDVEAAFGWLVAQGHTPVSPYRATDVMIVSVDTPKLSCEGAISPIVTVENAGTDTLYNFQIWFGTNNVNKTDTWNGILLPGSRISLQLSQLPISNGQYEITVRLQNPNGQTDERPLNDILKTTIRVNDRERFAVHAETPNGSVCENTPVLLRSDYAGPGEVQVKWYDTPLDGSVLGTGPVFVTPPVTAEKTWFASATYTTPVGLEDKNAGANVLTDTAGLGLVFDVYSEMTLKSVKVYAEETGARLFQLKDNQGNIVQQAVRTLNTTGEVEVSLGWKIKPGNGYVLIKASARALYLNTSGADYPYIIEDIMRIRGTNDNQTNNGAWYFFYDWKITYEEPCGRTPVTVGVSPSGNAPNVSFTASSDSLDLATVDGTVDFLNTTGGMVNWLWNFGDNSTSTLENPSHIFDAPGIYVVSLLATDAQGCSGFALDTIEVIKSEINSAPPVPAPTEHILVYPNPATDAVTVYFDMEYPVSGEVLLTDLTGRLLQKQVFNMQQRGELRLNLQNEAGGVFILVIKTGEQRSVWKVAKM